MKSARRCSFDQNCNQFGLIYQLIWLQNENEHAKRMKPVIKHKWHAHKPPNGCHSIWAHKPSASLEHESSWCQLKIYNNIASTYFGVGRIRYDRIIGQLIFPSHKLVNLIGTTRNSWGNKNMGENKISVAQQQQNQLQQQWPTLRRNGGGTTVTKWTRAIRVSFY